MEIVEDLQQLDKTLEQLKKDFNEQMNAIENDLGEFHKILINLSTKYPEQKELLEFIVFINDRIETSQTNMKEVLTESFNAIIYVKKEIIKQNIKSRKDQIKQNIKSRKDQIKQTPAPTVIKKALDKINFGELKWVLFGVIGILFLVILMCSPDLIFTTFEWIKELRG